MKLLKSPLNLTSLNKLKTFSESNQEENNKVKLIYSLLMFPVVLIFALCYYTISFPIMFVVGTYIVICGMLEKVDWNTYDRDII